MFGHSPTTMRCSDSYGCGTLLLRFIEKVMREVRRGKTVPQIAASCGMSRELAEQICRLYLTHPGVDADGIMTKMGL